MRKIISVLLIVAMSLTLCACGDKELTQAEREQIFYEVAKEKGLIEYINGNQSSITVEQGGYNFVTADLASGEHYIEILDMELVAADNGTYRPNIKLRNLFPEDAVEYYPDELRIYVSYLDSDGFGIASSWIQVKRLGYGQGVWTESTGDYFDKFNVDEVESIAITGYRFMSVKGGVAVYGEDFTFNPAITFYVDDMLPEDASNTSQTNSVAVEEVGIILKNTGFKVEAKVRNTSGIKRDVITVYFQVLDDNGDVIGENNLVVKDLESGQAAKGTSFTVSDCKPSDVGSIKFVSYSYGSFSGGTKNSWTSKPGDGGDFAKPYIFNIEDIK